MRLFRGTIDALSGALENDADPIEAIDESVGWATLLKVRHEVAAIAETAGEDPLIVAVDRYATLRKFAPALIEALEFQAGRGSARTIAAIRILRELNRSGKRDVPPDAPMPFKKEWRKLVIGADGKINRRLYETATLAHLRNKLRSGDVWVERSSAYRRFHSYLLPGSAAAPIASALGLPATADEWLDQRGKELNWRLKWFSQRLKRNHLEGVSFIDGRLAITPVRAAAPAEAEAFADRLDAMMPRIRVTEFLHEVARETGVLSSFTNLRTGRSAPTKTRCWRRSSPTRPISVSPEWLQPVRASPAISSSGPRTPISARVPIMRLSPPSSMLITVCAVWGDGTTSSSDGQFFRGGKRAAPGGDINSRYGVDPGFSFYTHVSDQHGPCHAKVISAATHEAPYVLDGLLHHGSNLNIAEHYTDTGGATDNVSEVRNAGAGLQQADCSGIMTT